VVAARSRTRGRKLNRRCARGGKDKQGRSRKSLVAGDVVITDFGISVRHLDRLLGGLLLATSPRVDWAKLIRRTFGIDASVARIAPAARACAPSSPRRRPQGRCWNTSACPPNGRRREPGAQTRTS
jgi:hypothetical protein